MTHPKKDQILAAARRRLLMHMHSFDPTTVASAEMSAAKADGTFMQLLEELFRQVITDFSPDLMVAQAWRQLAEHDEDGEDGDGDAP